MKALVLTEGGIASGTGHINRCGALAAELEARGIEVRTGLHGDDHAQDVADRLGLSSFPLLAWDGDAIAATLSGNDLVVVDSYLAGSAAYHAVAEGAPRRLWIDDFGRLPYPTGTVLNPVPGSRTFLEDSGTAPDCDFLCGPAFHPLRSAFVGTPSPRRHADVQEILCVLGGSDPTATTPVVLCAAREAFPDARVRAIVPRADQRDAWGGLAGARAELLESRTAEGMREAMEAADIVICGGGQTLQEGLRLGTPLLAVEIASNQRAQMDAFAAEGAILDAGRHDAPDFADRLADLLASLSSRERRQELSVLGPRLVDGLGCRRVVGHLFDWTRELRLRRAAPEDSRAIWEIHSDPPVRACSFSTDPIPWESHRSWYAEALGSRDLLFLAVEDASGRVVGTLRARREGPATTIGIALHRDLRGRGEGPRLLREACHLLDRTFPGGGPVHAWIGRENLASRRAFRAAGFLPSSTSEVQGDRVFQLHVRSVPS